MGEKGKRKAVLSLGAYIVRPEAFDAKGSRLR
jgi:hypothetical protein